MTQRQLRAAANHFAGHVTMACWLTGPLNSPQQVTVTTTPANCLELFPEALTASAVRALVNWRKPVGQAAARMRAMIALAGIRAEYEALEGLGGLDLNDTSWLDDLLEEEPANADLQIAADTLVDADLPSERAALVELAARVGQVMDTTEIAAMFGILRDVALELPARFFLGSPTVIDSLDGQEIDQFLGEALPPPWLDVNDADLEPSTSSSAEIRLAEAAKKLFRPQPPPSSDGQTDTLAPEGGPDINEK